MRKPYNPMINGSTEQLRRHGMTANEIDAFRREEQELAAASDAMWDAEQAKIKVAAEKWIEKFGKSAEEIAAMFERNRYQDISLIPQWLFSSPEAHRNFCAMMHDIGSQL